MASISPDVLYSTIEPPASAGITIPVLVSRYGPTTTEPAGARPRAPAGHPAAAGTRDTEHGGCRRLLRGSGRDAAQNRDRADPDARVLHRRRAGGDCRPLPGRDRRGLQRGRSAERIAERLSGAQPVNPHLSWAAAGWAVPPPPPRRLPPASLRAGTALARRGCCHDRRRPGRNQQGREQCP